MFKIKSFEDIKDHVNNFGCELVISEQELIVPEPGTKF